MFNISELWSTVSKGFSLLHGRLGNVEQDIAVVKADLAEVQNAYNELKSAGVLDDLKGIVQSMGAAQAAPKPAEQPAPAEQPIDPNTGLPVQG